jgi:hydrogenase expression/formation protein HypD
MDLVKPFRDPGRADKLLDMIHREATGRYMFMEVCGGHTAAVHRYGIKGLLPGNLSLISGPGCPVCVSSGSFIDHAIALSERPDVITASFGDLMRVPGSAKRTLDLARSRGADIKTVYSVTEALDLARKYPEKKIVFPAIGFETTAPGNAAAILEAKKLGTSNFLMLSTQKIMPPAMRAVAQGEKNINGFICPGHVSAITGSGIYGFLAEEYGTGCVIAGFEPVDILCSVLMLIRQVNSGRPDVETEYRRAVRPEGNVLAQKIMNMVFTLSDEWWRGFGMIPGSGLQLKPEYEEFDAVKAFPGYSFTEPETNGCICGDILRGTNTPVDCPLYNSECTPDHPVGACMVSAEGACNIYYGTGQALN